MKSARQTGKKPTEPFKVANRRYEAWLRTCCTVVEADLRAKHTLMRQSPFRFLRATYFRWAGTIEALCPDLADAPAVLTIGDAHIENFGCWRDAEGRLIWGANDFDEAATMPYPFDLVRLQTSARLAPFRVTTGRAMAAAILDGYAVGLHDPSPCVVYEQFAWLLDRLNCDGPAHLKFWHEIDALRRVRPSAAARTALEHAMPAESTAPKFLQRFAGGGSRGKPRYVAVADWRGGRVAREATALVPSAWDWAHGRPDAPSRYMQLSAAPWRAPDPFLSATASFLVRRLAPDSRKAELGPRAGAAIDRRLLLAMGREIGSLHGVDRSAARAIVRDLSHRPKGWLARAAKTAAAAVVRDYDQYKQQER